MLDDYNELLYLQTVLKKLGVDVDGVQSPRKFEEVRLGFNPQIIVVSALGKKVNGIGISANIRKANGLPKIIAMQTPSQDFQLDEVVDAGVDVLLDTPVNIRSFLEAIAQCGGVSFKSLLEKYSKLKLTGQISVSESFGRSNTDEELEKDYYDQEFEKYTEAMSEDKPDILGKNKSQQVSEENSSVNNLLERPDIALGRLKSKLESSLDVASRKKRFDDYLEKMEKLETNKCLDPNAVNDFNKNMRARRDKNLDDKVDNGRKEFVRALFNLTKKTN